MGPKNSRNKKGKKQPMVFAKNKNQAILAMVVLVAFIANTIYTAVKLYQENHPTIAAASQEVTNPNANNPALPNGQNPGQPTPDAAAVAPQDTSVQQDANNIYSQTVGLQKGASAQNPVAAQNKPSATSAENDVEIMQKTTRKNNGKMVMISVSSAGRTDPFMPSSEGFTGAYAYLTPPPETLPTNTDASKVMATTLSGILYDKYSPSAILNIEGTDYLVKRGDIINKYRVLSIGKTQVAVQLGRNIYKAGVGELLTQASFNEGNISNLNKRFGGNEVSINVKRKGY